MYLNENQLSKKINDLITEEAELIIQIRKNNDFKIMVELNNRIEMIESELEELDYNN